MKKVLCLFALVMLQSSIIKAQEDADFRMEIGGGIGSNFYMGDLNNKMLSCMQPAVGAYWRYLFDPYNPKSGSAADMPMKAKFTGGVIDMSCMYEINFFPYGYYQNFFGHKRLTPFLQIGLGLTYACVGKETGLNVPVGVGVKYRASKRLNVSFDWAMHFTTTDKIDGLEDPLGIKSSGFKNKDHYGVALLSLTYSFSPRCPNCNKAK